MANVNFYVYNEKKAVDYYARKKYFWCLNLDYKGFVMQHKK